MSTSRPLALILCSAIVWVSCGGAELEMRPTAPELFEWPEEQYVEPAVEGAAAEAVMSQESMSIEQVVALALVYHPSLAVQAAEIRIRDADRIAASIYPNPAIGVEGEDFTDDATLRLGISQEIILTSRRSLGQRAAVEHTDAARFELLAAQVAVIGEAKEAFVETWMAQERLGLLLEIEEAAREVFRTVEIQVELGAAPGLELLRAQVDLERSGVSVTGALTDLEAARMHLLSAMGLTQGTPPSCRALPDELPTLPPLESLEARLLRDHPAIQAAAAEVRGLELDRRRAEADATPNLEVGLWLGRGFVGDVNLFSFNFGIPLPLTDTNQGERAQLTASIDQASAEVHEVETAQVLALRSLYSLYDSARTTWELNRSRVVPIAEEAFRRTSTAYRLGESDYLEVIDARRRLSEAQIETLDAKMSAYLRLFEIERVLGGPLPVEEVDR